MNTILMPGSSRRVPRRPAFSIRLAALCAVLLLARICPAAVLSISKTHVGNFTQGQSGATYTITVSNAVTGSPTNGTVTVNETAPSGLSLVSMAGTGWTCATLAAPTCTRSDVLTVGASYPAITVTVNVLSTAASPQVNAVAVSGGGSGSANAYDSTTILATQTITFGALSNKAYGSAPFTVSATASSGLAVSFNSQTTSVCTVSGATVTLVAVGVCTIQATQAGNANYAAATPVNQSFQVTPGTQTITFGALSNKALGSAPFTVSATASSGLAVSFNSQTTSVCTVSGATVTLVAVGVCTIQATQAGNANYAAATPVNQSFQVTPGTQTITFGALSTKALGSAPFTVSATASSGLAVSFNSQTTSVCTVSSATVTLVAVGTCTIQATQAGNATYAAATPVNQSFSVTSGAPILSLTKTHAGNFTQGQAGATYAVTVSNAASGGPTNGTVTVTETAPSGLSLVSMAGTGWTCTTLQIPMCTRSDVLAAGASFPAITVTVNVATKATSPQVNTVSVSGGGSGSANATDSTTIVSVATLTVSCNPSSGPVMVGIPYTATCTVSGGAPGYTFSLSAGSLPSGLTAAAAATTYTISGMPATPGAYNYTVQVKDSSGQAATESFSGTISPAPSIGSFSVAPVVSVANQDTASLTLSSAPPVMLSGTLCLTFSAGSSVVGAYQSQEVVFANGTTSAACSSTLKTTLAFTVPAGSATAVWSGNSSQFSQGTVAGTITVTLNSLADPSGNSVLPSPAPSQTITVAAGTPTVSGSPSMTMTSSSVTVVFDAATPTRHVTGVNYVFNPGAIAVSVSFTSGSFNGYDQSQWFALPASQATGGAFSLSATFPCTNCSALTGVQVTLSN